MDDNGDTREDIKLPDNDLGKELSAKYEKGDDILATVLCACGEEAVVGHKPNTSGKK